MSVHTLSLTCPCGAALEFETQYGETLRKERAAFDLAHATCRAVTYVVRKPTPPVPLVSWDVG